MPDERCVYADLWIKNEKYIDLFTIRNHKCDVGFCSDSQIFFLLLGGESPLFLYFSLSLSLSLYLSISNDSRNRVEVIVEGNVYREVGSILMQVVFFCI